MNKLILSTFRNANMAEEAVYRLKEDGIDPKEISVIAREAEDIKTVENPGASVAEGAVSGAATGGVLGGLAGLLIGIGAITIPGIGALLIGGPIVAALGLAGTAATTISGAVTGALAGGLVGALVSFGVPEEEAQYYEERIRAGDVLLVVPTTLEHEDRITRTLELCGAAQIRAVDVDQRGNEIFKERPGDAYFGVRGGSVGTKKEDY